MAHGMTYFAIITVICIILLLARERRGDLFGQAILKLMASTGFIGCALVAGAWQSSFGRWVLVALVLSWAGDACLLSRRRREFLIGLACFLLAHLVYSVALVQLGVDRESLLLAGLVLTVVGFGVAFWLLPKVESGMQVPVAAYLVAISTMLAFGAGAAAAASDRGVPGPIASILLIAPLAFYFSDLFVARDRFVAHAFINRLWGLPLYYGAQILFAVSPRLLWSG
jgi:uncharacterized membrane protein YhhN